MKTAVIILNWNTRDYLKRWLPLLEKSCEGLDAEVVVADSASTDGSMEMMAEEFPGIRRIELDANYGFTGGYNRAVGTLLEEEDAPEYVVLINSDIEVSEGWLKPLTEWMDGHPDCGACGPRLHALLQEEGGFIRSGRFEYAGAAGGYIDRFGYPFCRGRVLKRTEIDEGQYGSPADVLWVTGACLMVRSSLWKELKGLDDRFFAHMEEIDLCWRIGLAGWKVTVVPDSIVWHLGGGTLPQDSPFKLKLNFRNGLLLLENNLSETFMARGCSAGKAGRKAGRRIFFRMMLDGGSAMVYLLQGHKDYFKAVIDAHGEYRRLRGQGSGTNRKEPVGPVRGYCTELCILPLSVIKGKGIFKYLKEYENRH